MYIIFSGTEQFYKMEFIYLNGMVIIFTFTFIGITIMNSVMLYVRNYKCKNCGKDLTATDIFFGKDKCFSCSQKQNQNEK